jgi:cytidylate kinase
MASTVATKKQVRAKLLQLQRDIAEKNNVIMDGRDIGTFVLPNAECKIYLTASVSVRAKRRYDELVSKGENPVLEKIENDIEKRDYQDMNREIAPLKQAEDAVYLDSSDMTIQEVVDKICSYGK